MWDLIRRISNNIYFYVKEIWLVLWYGTSMEGQVATKVGTIALQAWNKNNLQEPVKEAAKEIINEIKQHPVRSMAIAGMVTARYLSPVGVVAASKKISEQIAKTVTIPKTVPVQIEKLMPTKIRPMYDYSWSLIDSAFNNKYFKKIKLNNPNFDIKGSENILKWARKVKHGLQSADKVENNWIKYFLKIYPNEKKSWLQYFNSKPEYQQLKKTITAFSSLEDFPTPETLKAAIAELTVLKKLMHEFELVKTTTFVTKFVNEKTYETVTKIVPTFFGSLANLNKIFILAGTIGASLEAIMRNIYGVNPTPVVPVLQDQNHQADAIQREAQQNAIHQEINNHSILPEEKNAVPYPTTLSIFGCRQKKMTAHNVANTLWLIKSQQGHKAACQVSKQFSLWAENKKLNFETREVEKIYENAYQGKVVRLKQIKSKGKSFS